MTMDTKKEPKFCGNLLVRRTKRRSFLNKSTFDGVFGVLTNHSFDYYQSSVPWVSLLIEICALMILSFALIT